VLGAGFIRLRALRRAKGSVLYDRAPVLGVSGSGFSVKSLVEEVLV